MILIGRTAIVICASYVLVIGCGDKDSTGPNDAQTEQATSIAFESPSGIELIRPSDDSARILSRGDSLVFPTWSPDRSKIAFIRQRSGPSGSVLRVADSAGSVIVGAAAGLNSEHNPRWSPDGTRIVVELLDRILGLITPSGGSPASIPVRAADPVFLNDTVIVCVLPVDTGWNETRLATLALDGTILRMIADSTGGRFSVPRVFTGGDSLACIYEGRGFSEIMIIDVDGGHRRRLAKFGGPIIDLIPSPDARAVLIIPGSEDRLWVYIVSVASGFIGTLGDDESNGRLAAASWSPDGRQIAYARSGGGIAIINVDRSNYRVLVESGSSPNW